MKRLILLCLLLCGWVLIVSCTSQQKTQEVQLPPNTTPTLNTTPLPINLSPPPNTTVLSNQKHGCETFGVDRTMNETGASLCKKQGYETCKSFVIETYVAFYASKYGQCIGGQPQKDLWKSVQKYTCFAPIVVKPKECSSNQRAESKTDSSAEQLVKITCCSD